MDEVVENNTANSLDAAIEECSQNIRRNLRASLWEAVVTVVLLSLVGYFALSIARLQGEENDQKRKALRTEVSDITEEVQNLSARLVSAEAELKAATAEATDPKPESSGQQLLRFVKSKVARATEDLKAANEQRDKAIENLGKHKSPPLLTDPVLYGVAALFVVLVGLLVGLYRQHVREVTRNEQMRVGFHRIRIAANNAHLPGFGSEVRVSLTQGAFEANRDEGASKSKRVDSPLPGHPGSDFSSAIVNRLFEQVDIVLKPKPK